jgi:hypothetical protein
MASHEPNICSFCGRRFTRRDNMLRHVNNGRCKIKKNDQHIVEVIVQRFDEYKKETDRVFDKYKKETDRVIAELKQQKEREIAELKESIEAVKQTQSDQPKVNQVLQVICVGNTDNYLDMLTEKMGNFGEAIEYLRECALSDVSGDCRLIEKVYMTTDTMHYIDNGKTQITYYNEKQEKVIESKLTMGRRLANNLQNSYLKGINFLINRNLQQHTSPNKFLDEFDLLTWNTHIYNLSDVCYQKKFINKLSIPVSSASSTS